MDSLLQKTPSTDLSAPIDSDPRFLDYYRILRGQIEHEDNLVGSRISWFVTSQSFLFNGYAIIASGIQSTASQATLDAKHVLLVVIPLIAISTSILIFLAILSGLKAMAAVRHRYLVLCSKWEDALLPPIQGSRVTRMMGLAAPVMLPALFLTVWIFLLVRRLF